MMVFFDHADLAVAFPEQSPHPLGNFRFLLLFLYLFLYQFLLI